MCLQAWWKRAWRVNHTITCWHLQKRHLEHGVIPTSIVCICSIIQVCVVIYKKKYICYSSAIHANSSQKMSFVFANTNRRLVGNQALYFFSSCHRCLKTPSSHYPYLRLFLLSYCIASYCIASSYCILTKLAPNCKLIFVCSFPLPRFDSFLLSAFLCCTVKLLLS